MIELARRAVEATVAAGASDAEAFASEDAGREVRAHGGEVESLTAATRRGIGVRAWIGRRAGYAYGTDLSDAGIRELAARAAETARIADEDEFTGPPELPVRLMDPTGTKGAPEAGSGLDLSDPTIGDWPTERVAELALAIERAALEADPRVAGVEQAIYADSAERIAIASSTGIEASYERTSCYGYTQALAEGEGARETGLGFGLGRGPGALDPGEIGREAAARATEMIGAGKPASGSCPVVLDATVAASFVALIGRALGADAVQRGRSPFIGLAGETVADEAFVVHDDGLDPEGSASSPVDGEGTPAAPPRPDRGRRRCAPSSTTPTPRAARRAPRPGAPAAAATAPSPRSRPRTCSSPPGRSTSRGSWRRPGTACWSPTSPACTPASTR